MTQFQNKPVGMKPDRELQSHIRHHMRLEESLDEEMFAEKMMLVRHRIIGIFNKSVDPRTHRGVGGNYLVGVGPKSRQLAAFIQKRFGIRGVIRLDDLHPRYRGLTDYWRQQVIAKIVGELIDRQLRLMVDESDLWWLDNCGGIWEISQSVADEYAIQQSQIAMLYGEAYRASKPRQPYRDERAHHGKPSQQSRRRDRELRQAPGLSISSAGYGI